MREMASVLKPNENHTQKILKAHVSVLVSALGGPDYTSSNVPQPYKLGHDALACLKDIKRWIKSVDERGQSYDVALACADSGLLVNDLTVMLCQWDSQASKGEPIKNARTMEKIMLANLELLVLLTWPTELTPESSESQRLSFSNLRKTQLVYKRHILHYNKGQTLKAVIRLVLATMAKEKADREPKDNAILRLVLFFIRNILYIAPITSSISMKTTKDLASLDSMPAGVTTEDISMSTVLNCFKRNKVLMFLLTMSNSVGSDFDKQMFGPACLECIYLLVKNIQVEHIISPVKLDKHPQTNPAPVSSESAAGSQLTDLLKEETKRKISQKQHLSTRHGRFGSLLSIQGDEQSYVISGQEALLNANSSLDKLDRSKKWTKPKSFRYDSDEFTRGERLYLNTGSILILKEFINQFLAGACFNNLISNTSSLFSSADDLITIDPYERAVYFLTLAWFLRYKRERNQLLKDNPKMLENLTDDDDSVNFSSIRAALSQTNFILILHYFRNSYTIKEWSSVHVAMIAFLELLLISHTLFISKPKEVEADEEESQEELDKELGEGIIRNLFTSNDFLNVLVQLPQSASKHSPEYLKTCIHIVHILLKSFESFTKENVKLYIQKRRRKVKRRGEGANDMDGRILHRLEERGMGYSEDEEADEERAKEEKIERELDLAKTEIRFFHTATVTSYIDYLAEYEELTHEEIKRCLSYFHRLFVVKKDHSALYRLDFMYVLHRLRSYLPRSSSMRNHVDEFIVYFMKKFKVAFARFPNPIEILFPRFEEHEIKTFLTTGELTSRYSESKSQPKLARQIDFIREFSFEEKVKILITALYLEEKEAFIAWLISALDAIIQKRLLDVASGSTEDARAISLQAPDKFRRLLINNPQIRCLLTLVKFDLPDILEENCEIPGSVTSAKLVEFLEFIKKYIAAQPVNFEDGKDAFFFLITKDSYGYDDDYDINYRGYDPEDESIAFETAGNQEKSHYMEELDQLDRLEASISSVGHGQLGVARKKRKEKANKPPKKSSRAPKETGPRGSRPRQPVALPQHFTKSAEFINDSDDDSDEEKDEEFFAREEKLRRLLSESGGIVNSTQLEDFKKVWKILATDTDKDLETSVNKAVANATDNLRASQHQQSQDLFGSFSDTQTQTQTQTQFSNDDENNVNNSTRLSYSSESDLSSDEETLTNDVDESLTRDENKENETPTGTQVNPRKRPMVFSDNESDDENVSFVSASGDVSLRKRKIVLDDDDDDDE
ncbi:timeless-domain-containing protein [Yamadazyma tenuis ATCC 10573]|uniref:Topoisomerase 1-associated factor 1 n=2 Tax=Candida tenuis TaxID=2315449 RepID=G3B6I2_CANTC|nr:timeless-domain-containing protein [Yamadazyma tenuis ATCC 10573]EGV63474.1 timeless-domain-containing protein [Yamadazyma tenuis ATCC 10573]